MTQQSAGGDGNATEQKSEGGEVADEMQNDVSKQQNQGTDGTYTEVKVVTDKAYDYEEIKYACMSVDSINTGENVPAALKDAVAQWNAERKTFTVSEYETAKSNARQDAQDAPEYFYGPYEVYNDVYIKRSDSKVLSAQSTYYGYYGGTHGSIVYTTRNWDAQTGAVISLDAVFPDRNKLIEVLAGKMDEKYPGIMLFAESSREALEEYFEITDDSNVAWTLDYDGVTFYFSHYELAAYSEGVQRIKILYSEIPELFTQSYFTAAPADYIEQFETSMQTETDLDGDGIINNVTVVPFYSYEYDMFNRYQIMVDDTMLQVDAFCYDFKQYLIRQDGKTFLYVERSVDSDGTEIDIYELSDQTILPVSTEYFGIEYFTNPNYFVMRCRVDILGTYFGMMTARIGADGMPAYLENDFKLLEYSITSKVDLTVQTIDAGGNVTGEVVCPAGTVFVFDRTDGVSYMDMKLSDGTRCRITVEGSGTQTVNGMNASDCFDGLIYAS